jgi:hypothetical protein
MNSGTVRRVKWSSRIGVVLLLIFLLHAAFYYLPRFVSLYHHWFFIPLESARNYVLNLLPFSFGDLLYTASALLLLFAIPRFVYLALRSRKRLGPSLLQGLYSLLLVYLVLLLAWGGNYFRPPLTDQLQLLPAAALQHDDMVAFDSVLTDRLNVFIKQYRNSSRKELDPLASRFYRQRNTLPPVYAKASLFGIAMAYLGIEGYYNPFTGEAQFNDHIPPFMKPFVLAHEMAHQTGIAAEGDANLMAYIVCSESGNGTYQYSACFNIWLYTHRYVRMTDSVAARRSRERLNAISLAQVDTLRAIRRRYSSAAGDYSSQVYDAYLRLGNQQEGIESYRNVAFSALAWEIKKGLIRQRPVNKQ